MRSPRGLNISRLSLSVTWRARPLASFTQTIGSRKDSPVLDTTTQRAQATAVPVAETQWTWEHAPYLLVEKLYRIDELAALDVVLEEDLIVDCLVGGGQPIHPCLRCCQAPYPSAAGSAGFHWTQGSSC